jgi:hypothetical protein
MMKQVVTCRNEVLDEIRKVVNSGNACYYSVQELLSCGFSRAPILYLYSYFEGCEM